MKKLRSAVIGVGYLGKFHAEKYASLENTDLIAVCDNNKEQAELIAQKTSCKAFTDYKEIAALVDIVSIATPTQYHFEVAKYFLEQGIHVLIEKPITQTAAEAEELIAIANKNKLLIQVGHLERFNPAILLLGDMLNDVRFIESHRLSQFQARGTEVNVILDLMIHDIEIIQHISQSKVAHIDAKGLSILSGDIDIANARVRFENGCIANVTASRVSLKQERKIRIFQKDSYISIDLQKKELKVAKKEDGEQSSGLPKIASISKSFEQNDALKLEIAAFIDAVSNNKAPVVSGEDGLRALRTAIEITNLIKEEEQK